MQRAMREVQTTSRDTCTVACKLPLGLILHLDKMVDDVDRGIGGTTKDIKVARKLPMRVIINGSGSDRDHPKEYDIRSGFGLTYGVDREFMEHWLNNNREADVVKNKLIFISADDREAAAQAKDLKSVLTGMEPMKQDGDPRMPKGKFAIVKGELKD